MSSASSPKVCRNETLSTGQAVLIQRCRDCGTISIHLGAITIRLDAAACESLWATLGGALGELHRSELDKLFGDSASPSQARGVS
jgi:hypothetical protein